MVGGPVVDVREVRYAHTVVMYQVDVQVGGCCSNIGGCCSTNESKEAEDRSKAHAMNVTHNSAVMCTVSWSMFEVR